MATKFMSISDRILDDIRETISGVDSHQKIAREITDRLIDADIELHEEPSLEEMKRLLVDAVRESDVNPIPATPHAASNTPVTTG